jgi:hypothetical protein
MDGVGVKVSVGVGRAAFTISDGITSGVDALVMGISSVPFVGGGFVGVVPAYL